MIKNTLKTTFFISILVLLNSCKKEYGAIEGFVFYWESGIKKALSNDTKVTLYQNGKATSQKIGVQNGKYYFHKVLYGDNLSVCFEHNNFVKTQSSGFSLIDKVFKLGDVEMQVKTQNGKVVYKIMEIEEGKKSYDYQPLKDQFQLLFQPHNRILNNKIQTCTTSHFGEFSINYLSKDQYFVCIKHDILILDSVLVNYNINDSCITVPGICNLLWNFADDYDLENTTISLNGPVDNPGIGYSGVYTKQKGNGLATFVAAFTGLYKLKFTHEDYYKLDTTVEISKNQRNIEVALKLRPKFKVMVSGAVNLSPSVPSKQIKFYKPGKGELVWKIVARDEHGKEIDTSKWLTVSPSSGWSGSGEDLTITISLKNPESGGTSAAVLHLITTVDNKDITESKFSVIFKNPK